MKRSQFIKLTASSMAATTFLSFPAFSRGREQEGSYVDIFRTYVEDENNHLHEIFVKMNLDYDPELKMPIHVEYIRDSGRAGKIGCRYTFTKKKQPSDIGQYKRYYVGRESENPYCSTRDDINSFSAGDDYDEKIYNILKTISYIDFKPRRRTVANSEYEKARLVDHSKEILFELDYLQTAEEDCFLTTACVEHKGLPDNCDELQKLRFFRDHFMQNHPEGKELIADYYVLAPAIVSELSKEPNDDIYEFIYNELVLKCLNLIEDNKPELAMYYYKSFTEELSQKVLN